MLNRFLEKYEHTVKGVLIGLVMSAVFLTSLLMPWPTKHDRARQMLFDQRLEQLEKQIEQLDKKTHKLDLKLVDCR